MANQFSPSVSQILAFSKEEALRLASRQVGPEHLLLAMLRLKEGIVSYVFDTLSVDRNAIKHELEDKIKEDCIGEAFDEQQVTLNENANNILKLAVLEARIQHVQNVEEIHLLLGLLHDCSNGAKSILEEHSITYDDVIGTLKPQGNTTDSIGMTDDDIDDDIEDRRMSPTQRQATNDKKAGSKTPMLNNFGTDLTELAASGALDPVVGRDKEIERVTEILGRRKKNNPVLIGEPGVGKSAIVEGLAQRIVKRKTAPILFNKRVITLDLAGIVAGTKYRGQFEERIRALINEIENTPNLIIFIDEIHTMVGAGSTPGSMDAANLLKPALARGTIQCIGASTLKEYRNSIEKDGALERRFQKIIVNPTTDEETIQILENIKDRYEKHHHVNYTDEAIKACVGLTARYVAERQFPDKAIDALDETGSHVHMSKCEVPQEITDIEDEIEQTKAKKQAAVQNQNFELAAAFRDKQTQLEKELEKLNSQWMYEDKSKRQTVTENDVADVVSRMTGIPAKRMGESETNRLKSMAPQLKEEVIAQDAAIDKMTKSIMRNRVGLRDPNHPIGVFMFLGPTGVGKTLLAKKLAEYMFGSKDALIRIDMSEYTEQFNASRLIGAPPGYVGYGEGGQLTEKVRRHPYSIILLDEIEKAHEKIFNLLLQVFDEGRMTDGEGRIVDFRNTVIIMTSNAGTRQLKDFSHGVGFTAAGTHNGIATNERDKEYARGVINKALSRQFSPEFLNRIDDIITFDQLDKNAIRRIVDLEIRSLTQRIEGMGYHLDMSDKAKDFLGSKGYDVQFGARPLKRAIQTYVEDGLCEILIDNDVPEGACISIGKKPNKEELDFKVR